VEERALGIATAARPASISTRSRGLVALFQRRCADQRQIRIANKIRNILPLALRRLPQKNLAQRKCSLLLLTI